ncbi:GPR1/FUN34/yaaH family-domain-containing protein [Xylaria bambusicola]|uniref:GPR1/FUN34/yaaH family-domain-containing protein n=1 Tax=Xylaria bambusicola TaxID=326684 RepID=UPI0020083B81|nr:GPR1/FUN34/yaaH family-domain-containing protein [Xylaria bambusicola]KAI0516718.1 GPR1/FUN34/yaaH family-domain-containing protein [Xylaria bambusicola]
MSNYHHGISVAEPNYGSSSTHTLTPCQTGDRDVEKGFGRDQTTVSMPSELFEKLYLTPKAPHADNNVRRFANPTPLGFVGFVISTFTFSMILLGFGGSSGLSPVVGIFLFTGPVLLFVAMIFEWIMGNFFPMMVMGLFTVFWLSFGLLNLPTLELGSPFATPNDPTGLSSQGYNAAVALYLIVWGFALFTFFIFTLRINLVFASLFFIVSIGAWVLGAAYFKVSYGDYAGAMVCQKAGASLLFVDGFLGWYACFSMMAAEMHMPLKLPFGDLSHFWANSHVEMKSE